MENYLKRHCGNAKTAKSAYDHFAETASWFETLPSGQRNANLCRLVWSAYHAGYADTLTLTQAVTDVYEKCSGGADYRDIETTVRNVLERAGCAGSEKDCRPRAKTKETLDVAEKHRGLWQKWIDGILPSSSTARTDNTDSIETIEAISSNAVSIMKKLVGELSDTEYIFCGGLKTDRQPWSYFDKGWNPKTVCNACVWTPNKLMERTRQKGFVKNVRYMLLELDEPLQKIDAVKGTEEWYDGIYQQQCRFWNAIGDRLPIASVVYSGGKSLHVLVAVDTTVKEMDENRDRLERLYSELHFDVANIDATRKTRVPYGLRWYVKTDDGLLIDAVKVEDLLAMARGTGEEANKARQTIRKYGIDTRNLNKTARLQDVLYVAENAVHVSLTAFMDALEGIVNEILPTVSNPIEKYVMDGKEAPLTAEMFRNLLDYSGWKLYLDTTMNAPVLETGDRIVDKEETILNICLDRWMEVFGKVQPPSSMKMEANIKQVCGENRVSRANEWLESLSWDGIDRLGDIYSILGIKTEIEKTLVRKWLIQTCALQENDEHLQLATCGVLTFVGRQKAGKTTFLTGLLPKGKTEWVQEGKGLNVDSKDDLMQLLRGMIAELGEVDETVGREQTRLKAVITAKKHEIRLPYDRSVTKVWAHVSLCASVNKREFLKDQTGNRRWWVIEPASKIDLEALGKLDKEQLWAQVKNIWDNSDKTQWWKTYGLDDEEEDTLTIRNATRFRADSGYENAIRETFRFDEPRSKWVRITASKLAGLVANRNESGNYVNLSQKEINAISRCLASMPEIEKGRCSAGVYYLMPPPFTEAKERNDLVKNCNDGITSVPVSAQVSGVPKSDDMTNDPLFGDCPR